MSRVGGPGRGRGGGASPRRRCGGPAVGPGPWTGSRCRSGPPKRGGTRPRRLGLWQKCLLRIPPPSSLGNKTNIL